MNRARWLLAAAVATSACTLEDGAWFAELRPQLTARYLGAADRDVDGRFQRLASGYQVALERAELTIERLELLAAGAAGRRFDPAHPPPVRIEASGTSLRLDGVARGGPGAPQPVVERRFSVELPAPGAPLGRWSGPLDLPADNRHPPGVDLDVTIDLGPALFDRIDWTTFPDEPGRGLLAEA